MAALSCKVDSCSRDRILTCLRPVMIFFGGSIQIIAAVGEWILGNTFVTCLFFTYGSFWIVAGTTLIPWFNVGAEYSNPVGNTFAGMDQPSYFATAGTWSWWIRNDLVNMIVGFYYLSLAVLTMIFAICALRTNVVFVCALVTLVGAFSCAGGAYFNFALGNLEFGGKLVVVGIMSLLRLAMLTIVGFGCSHLRTYRHGVVSARRTAVSQACRNQMP
jgi:succinate-acetate transporter protein